MIKLWSLCAATAGGYCCGREMGRQGVDVMPDVHFCLLDSE